MKAAFKPQQLQSKVQEIQDTITGYWENDVWDIKDPVFSEFIDISSKKTCRNINFSSFPSDLKNEMKFYILKRFRQKEIKFDTLLKDYCSSFKQVAAFLEKYHSNKSSFSEIDIDKTLIQLRSFLLDRNIKLRSYRSNRRFTRYETLIHQVHGFYADFYDTRSMYEKDIWDIREIASSKVLEHASHYLLNFTGIPRPFMDMAKRYIKYRISYLSHGQCRTDIMGMKLFFVFINKRYPDWTDLRLLSRKDMEDYLSWFNDYTQNFKGSQKAYFIALHTFLENIQKFDYQDAPQTLISMLVLKEDFPKHARWGNTEIKYIPEGVLQQLDENIEYLTPSEYIPIIILLRASGWRISDILHLK